MSTLRSILLHLDASPRCAARLALARDLAALHGARVTALYASTSSLFDLPYSMSVGAADALPLLRQVDTDRRDAARALFDRMLAPPGAEPTMQWRELAGEPVLPGVTRHALCNDLLVLGQHDPNDPAAFGVPSDLVASVLLASGRPALVIPYVNSARTVGDEVLIAWKPTRESAHALSAAIPLLQRARQIHLTCDEQRGAQTARASDVEEYLRLHGVLAPLHQHAAMPPDAPGEGLLSLVADTGADLLVMGCYGHSRARELVLGGATRSVLKSMTVPVLMGH